MSARAANIRDPDRSGSGAQGFDARLHRRFDLAVAFLAILAQAVDDLGDHAADLAKLGRAEAAGGAGRRAEADAGGDERLGRIVGDRILVAGDRGAIERLLRGLAGRLLGPQVDEQQMIVGPARDDVEALLLQRFGQGPGIFDDVPRIEL